MKVWVKDNGNRCFIARLKKRLINGSRSTSATRRQSRNFQRHLSIVLQMKWITLKTATLFHYAKIMFGLAQFYQTHATRFDHISAKRKFDLRLILSIRL